MNDNEKMDLTFYIIFNVVSETKNNFKTDNLEYYNLVSKYLDNSLSFFNNVTSISNDNVSITNYEEFPFSLHYFFEYINAGLKISDTKDVAHSVVQQLQKKLIKII